MKASPTKVWGGLDHNPGLTRFDVITLSDINKIECLHEHALVAWDREGLYFPDDTECLWIAKWIHPNWAVSINGPRKSNGLGCIMRGSTGVFYRAVLTSEPTDPLGVRWWLDPLSLPKGGDSCLISFKPGDYLPHQVDE